MEDKYSMKDVQECIDEIGQSGSTLFTMIDLTARFWQMILQPKARQYTAFTVPGQGQCQWVTTPMGLLGAPGSFQRLMEKVVEDIHKTQVYIDDLLCHSADHWEGLSMEDRGPASQGPSSLQGVAKSSDNRTSVSLSKEK